MKEKKTIFTTSGNKIQIEKGFNTEGKAGIRAVFTIEASDNLEAEATIFAAYTTEEIRNRAWDAMDSEYADYIYEMGVEQTMKALGEMEDGL